MHEELISHLVELLRPLFQGSPKHWPGARAADGRDCIRVKWIDEASNKPRTFEVWFEAKDFAEAFERADEQDKQVGDEGIVLLVKKALALGQSEVSLHLEDHWPSD